MKRRLKTGIPRGRVPPQIAKQPANEPSPAIRPPSRWLFLGVSLLLATAVWLVFGQTRHFDFVNYDDGLYVYENPAVIKGLSWANIGWAFTHSVASCWHPVTLLSHMLDCELYGLNPGSHHLTSVAIHALTAVSLMLMLHHLTGSFWRSAFVAAVFAVHPLHVESVAWIAERKDVLSALFFVLTLWTYSLYVQKMPVPGPGAAIWFALSLFLFALGLMSKPMLVTLPCVLLLLDFWPLKRFTLQELRPTHAARLLLEKTPFFTLVALDCLATIRAQENAILLGNVYDLRIRVGNAILSYADYLGQMIDPADLTIFYSHPGNQLPAAKLTLSLLLLLLVSFWALCESKNRPYLLVGWLWYLGMLVPVIGLIQVGQQSHADRYTYLPQIGLYILLTWGAVERFGTSRHRRVLLGSTALAALIALISLACLQTAHWKNSVTLWSHTVSHTSENYIAENNLAAALTKEGDIKDAIFHFRRAALSPIESVEHAKAEYNLGVLSARIGRPEEAAAYYKLAIQHESKQSPYVDADLNLGVLLADQGKVDEAIRHFERVLSLQPESADAHGNLGLLLLKLGRAAEAIPHFEGLLKKDPGNASAHFNLGNAFRSQGRSEAALQEYERALKIFPAYSDTHQNLGVLLLDLGRLDEAAAHFEQAFRSNPNLAQAHFCLGVVWARQKKWPPSIDQFQTALSLARAQQATHLMTVIQSQLQAAEAARLTPEKH